VTDDRGRALLRDLQSLLDGRRAARPEPAGGS
jgi:hypothetical protein